MKYVLLATILALFVACSPAQSSIEDQIKGTWENVSLTVKMKQDDGSDSLMVVNEGQWEAILQIKPIVTEYRADGSFTSTYYGLDGNQVGEEFGTWLVRNDSLILKSAGYDFAYKTTFDGDKARFVSLLDFDQDGKADDHYDGWQKRVKK